MPTYGKEDRGWKDIGTSKELIEQHSLVRRAALNQWLSVISWHLPNPEDTVMVGSTAAPAWCFHGSRA